MVFAAIDIGSNAVRLFLANVFDHNGLVTIEKYSLVRVPLRLGLDVFTKGEISIEKIEKFAKTMQAFKLLIDVQEPVAYKVCATAAMREASNNNEVIDIVEKRSGIKINIIDGIEEAKIVCANCNIAIADKYKMTMYVDVGGGSTEISMLQQGKMIASSSYKIGTLRILNEKVTQDEWARMKKWLKDFSEYYGKIFCIGSGGNINKIAKIYGKRDEMTLTFDQLEYAIQHLNNFSNEERIEYMGLKPDRADVIIPASGVFHAIMKQTKLNSLYVPKIGLADGLIHILYKEYKDKTI